MAMANILLVSLIRDIQSRIYRIYSSQPYFPNRISAPSYSSKAAVNVRSGMEPGNWLGSFQNCLRNAV